MGVFDNLSTAELESYRGRLVEALQLITLGENAQTQGYDGKQVTFTKTDGPTIRNAIAEVDRALGKPSSRRHAARPLF